MYSNFKNVLNYKCKLLSSGTSKTNYFFLGGGGHYIHGGCIHVHVYTWSMGGRTNNNNNNNNKKYFHKDSCKQVVLTHSDIIFCDKTNLDIPPWL